MLGRHVLVLPCTHGSSVQHGSLLAACCPRGPRRKVPGAWRITNSNDLVPTMPRLMGYCHVRHGVRLTSEGQLVFETEGLADVFGEGRSHAEVLGELLGKVGGQQG